MGYYLTQRKSVLILDQLLKSKLFMTTKRRVSRHAFLFKSITECNPFVMSI